MKVVFVNKVISMSRGGGETFDINLAKSLREKGLGISFVTTKPLPQRIRYLIKDFKTFYCKSFYFREYLEKLYAFNFFPFSSIISRLQKVDHITFMRVTERLLVKIQDKYDILQSNAFPELLVNVKKKTKKPVVVHFMGPPSLNDAEYIKKCDAVIADGDAFLKIKKEFKGNFYNIPPGINTKLFRKIKNNMKEKLGLEKKTVLLYTGRLSKLKNIPFMINGFAEALRENKDLVLMLVGEGPFKNLLINQTKRLKIQDSVFFIKAVSQDRLAEYYSMADMFIITSSYDNFPNSVLEAMACELPVIGTNVGGIPMQIKHKKNGLLVKSNNTKQLKESILTLTSNKELCKKMGKINKEVIKKTHNWEKCADKFLQVYNEVLK